jgi:hypothetical protein
LGNKGPLKVLNGTKLILDDYGNNLDSFRISLESFRSFGGPLSPEPVTGQELFFAVTYSKPALEYKFTISFPGFWFLPDRYNWWWEWYGSNAEIDTAIKTTKSMGWTICISDSWTPTGTYFTST